ncbi:hypothetical protein I302_100505 [Kwoniella bestiolae CBS 10118]|uniref:Uncharacterized protein n=1 Tax=Kwoniella bestiolae CBS 10118 TaxID=1296100 RepID=A0A1B9G582_9TREE|nr:hypothetical protein I302_03878 [Kwoniella bestiolae CBS 10118]OCF26199.1 hypothetical protein I302_03878 [Kwoniella bestiolae CBS 10118]
MRLTILALVASAAMASATPALKARQSSSGGYGDCRDTEGSCPGGSCVAGDSSNPDSGYICSFESASSSATSAAASESSSASSSSSSGSYGDCRDTENSCPGGACVAGDASNPNSGYVCSFESSVIASASKAATTATSAAAKTTSAAGTAPTTMAAATSAKASTTASKAATTALAASASASASNSTTSSIPNSGSGAGLSFTVNYAVAGLFAAGLYVAL